MNKKEAKEIRITETIINNLSSSCDITDEWSTNADIHFLLSEPFEFNVFCVRYMIDRIKLLCGWDGPYLFYADEKDHFHSLPVSKLFVKKVYDELLIVQKEERFKNYTFDSELFEMLRDERMITLY